MKTRAMLAAIGATLAFGTASADPGSPVRRLELGPFVLPVHAGLWRVDPRPGGYALTCASSIDCPGETVTLLLEDASAARCDDHALGARARAANSMYADGEADIDLSIIDKEGFDLRVARVELGCRNWAGSPVFACARLDAAVLSVAADPGGCATPPHFDVPVMRLLATLSAR